MRPGTWGAVRFEHRPDGRIRARAKFRELTGEYHQLGATGDTEAEAERLLRARGVVGQRDGIVLRPDSSVQELARWWLAGLRLRDQVTKNTLENYARDSRHVTSLIGGLRLHELSVPLLEQVLMDLAVDSPALANRARGVLKRAEVRMQVAYSPQATRDLLAFLGGERRSARVRRVVAANPNTPTEVLRLLADDEDAEVRHAVAFSGATPASLLAELAARSIDLALLVALNPDTPIEVLGALAEDSDPLVRFVACGARSGRAEAGDGSGRELAAFEGFDAKSIGESSASRSLAPEVASAIDRSRGRDRLTRT